MSFNFVQCFFLLFCPIVLANITNITSDEVEEAKRINTGFHCTIPKILQIGKNETVCLSTHFARSSSIKVIIDLKIKDKHYITTKTLGSEHYNCFDLNITNIQIKEPKFVTVKIQIFINNKLYTAHNLDPIVIYPFKRNIFIETDRQFYKPGDLVKFRILTLNPNMLPPKNYKFEISGSYDATLQNKQLNKCIRDVIKNSPEVERSENLEISSIRIRNPLDIVVSVWDNVSTDLGLAQLEQQLTKESLEGTWRIETDGEIKYFEVKKYVLPRFNIELDYPKSIYYGWKSIPLQICAKYKFGADVKGTASVKLNDFDQNFPQILLTKQMIKGCANFTITSQDMKLNEIKTKYSRLSDVKLMVDITATVIEHGTEQFEKKMEKSVITLRPFNLLFKSDTIFMPGLPYFGKIVIENVHIPLDEQVVQVCYNLAIRRSWNYFNDEQCSNFTLVNEAIEFQIPPLKHNVIHLHIHANSLNFSYIGDSILAVRLYSPNSNYLQIEQNDHVQDCKTMQYFNISYTTDHFRHGENIVFYYMIKTRGQLIKLKKVIHTVQKNITYPDQYRQIGDKHRHLKNTPNFDRFQIKFKLDERIITDYELLVYYVNEHGETVTASTSVHLNSCLNRIVVVWVTKRVPPGSPVALLIGTNSESLCAVTSVDKAVTFMNNIEILDAQKYLKSSVKEMESPQSGRKTCISSPKRDKDEASTMVENIEQNWEMRRRKRHTYSFSEDIDAYDVFNKFGVNTITNFKMITKPCYSGPSIPPPAPTVQSLTNQYNNDVDDKTVPIRTFFPETWLWELIPVQQIEIVHRDLPHTITDWLTNVMCVSETHGVVFGNTTIVSAFQPFFVELAMPYSIKKGEILYLGVITFNYLDHNLPIRISLGDPPGLILVDLMNRKSVSYCVHSNDSITHIFELKGVEAGLKNITVLAEIDPTYPGQCGPEILINKRDVISKTLLVEPEGYQMKITKSAFICGSDPQVPKSLTWSIPIPNDIVPSTLATTITLNSDLLIQTVQNLEQLLNMPTGCGEQIMSSMAPNLYILRYLKATNSLTHSLKQRIFRNLKIGYQRILNYAHKDGSFSAFGYYDPAGSMFLTTFVIRVLKEAKNFIYIDQKIIDKGVEWILEHQLENGCFSTMNHVFQDMGESNTENSTAALTAYVIISLLEANISIPEAIKMNAKYCIRGHYHLDKYTLAISSYALFKIHWYTEAQKMVNKLEQISDQQDGMLWWNSKDMNNSTASDIEITSYVLLSMLYHKTQENLAKAHSILRWLLTKLGPNGGFQSTQDTVVALDALTKYAMFINNQKLNLNISISTLHQENHYLLRNQDRMKSKKVFIKRPEDDKMVSVRADGDGCILVQLLSSYYLRQLPYSDTFQLNTEISSVSNIDECSIAKLSFCFSHKESLSNMAILEVELPSGYHADRASLYRLKNNNESRLKMFEETNNTVVLYFTKVDKNQICVNFNIIEDSIVKSRSESTVKLYDYYKPEYEVLQFYKLKEKCKFYNESFGRLIFENNHIDNITEIV